MTNNLINYISLTEIWLAIGIICFIVEFFAAPNIGFLFFGFGALSNSVLLHNYSIKLTDQLTIFGLLTLIWFIILWIPLKKYVHSRSSTRQANYSDMINKEVEVYSTTILPGKTGQVKWSGAVMNAMLDRKELEGVKSGDKIFITEVKGNILICSKDI